VALSRNIKADRGLTTRMLMTGFFIVLLYAAFIGVLFIFLHSLVLILVIAFGLLFCQYFFSDKIAMFAMHAKEVTPEQAPELHGIIDRLCALADMPKPRVAIANTDIPNAFATGRSPKAAVVCATSGLLRRLDEPEVEAVLAHEISHVAHRDVAVMTIASGLGMIAGLLTRVMFYSEIFGGMGGGFGGGRGRNNNSGGQLVMIEMLVLLVSVVVYFLSFMLTMALSRYRELAADRSGALLIGRPSLLASALVKITGEIGRIPTRDLRSAEPFNAFFFAPATAAHGAQDTRGQGGGSSFSFGDLFRTHPSLERRLAQLSQLEQQLNLPH
jgi:heat shock protein HtpX